MAWRRWSRPARATSRARRGSGSGPRAPGRGAVRREPAARQAAARACVTTIPCGSVVSRVGGGARLRRANSVQITLTVRGVARPHGSTVHCFPRHDRVPVPASHRHRPPDTDSRFGGRGGLRYAAGRRGAPRVCGRSCCLPRCRPSKWSRPRGLRAYPSARHARRPLHARTRNCDSKPRVLVLLQHVRLGAPPDGLHDSP